MSLKNQAVRGLKWTTTASVVGTILQLLQLLILARLLTKEHFGLMALAMVLVGLAQIFSDMGITNAIIHKKDVTKPQLHTIYFINIAIGVTLCLLLLIAAPAISAFYEHPELVGVIRWMSLIFIVQPFGQIYNALLRKELQFDAIAKRDMIAKLVSLIVSVTLATQGFGVYSFVGAQLASTTLSVVLLVLLGSKLYRPKLHIARNDIKPFLHFSAYQIGDQLVTFSRMQFDVLLIGKLMSIELVGIYNMAKRLIDYPIGIINPVITQVSFPVMAKVQDESLRLKNIFLKTMGYTMAFGFPVYAFIALFAHNLIPVAVGKQWIDAAPLMQILCIYGIVRIAFNPVPPLTLSRGFVQLSFWWNIGCFVVMPLFLLLGIPFGMQGVAWGVSASYLAIIIPLWYVLIRPCIPCKLTEYLGHFIRPLLSSAILTLMLLPLVLWVHRPITQLVAGGLVFLAAFLPVSKITNPPFYTELTLQLREAWSKHIKKRKA